MNAGPARRRPLPAVALVVVALGAVPLMVAACGDASDESSLTGSGDTDRAQQTGRVTDLSGSSWVLDRLVDGAVETPAVNSPTLEFGTGDRLSGSTGCNSFSGSFRQDGFDLRLDPGAMTRRGCEDETVQAQEEAILTRLPAVRSFTIARDELVLLDAAGGATLIYSPGRTDLAGSSWQVTGVNNGRDAVESSALTEALTMDFGDDGRISGSDGCNRYAGGYRTEGDALVIEDLAGTMMACPEDVMAMADQFRAALQATATFQISGDQLTLRDDDGAMQVTATATATATG